ncbi:hypothetical protein [Mesorhizobium sp. B2-1-3A]|nr:hypothetical protein [Mesorhizobium sp. B2-1-3A]
MAKNRLTGLQDSSKMAHAQRHGAKAASNGRIEYVAADKGKAANGGYR